MICMITRINGIVMSILMMLRLEESSLIAFDGLLSWCGKASLRGSSCIICLCPRSCTSFESEMDLLALKVQFSSLFCLLVSRHIFSPCDVSLVDAHLLWDHIEKH